MPDFGEMFDKLIVKAYAKNDYDNSGKVDSKEAYIALMSVYDKVNKLLPFYIKPPKYTELLMFCKKADVSESAMTVEEFKKVCKMVIGGEKSTVTRSLWFRVAWHAVLELVMYAATAEAVCRVLDNPDWLRPSVLVVLLKVGYKVASMVANKKLLEGDED